MTMNSSGPISLAGTTAGQSIEIENGGNGTTTISLNDTAVRTLAGVPSGAITMPTNFYGKSNTVTISYTFTTSTVNASLAMSAISGYSSGKSIITVTVNSGIYLWANSTANYGLNLTGGVSGDTLTLVNNGYIMGQGGNPGGPALNIGTGINITINNVGYIGGGGGNGAAGGGSNYGNGGGAAGGGSYRAGCGRGGGGAIGAKGQNGGRVDYPCCSTIFYSGGGGRIFPGCGGAGGQQNGALGGGAGGGATGYPGTNGGAGGAGSAAGTSGTSGTCTGGGGGGWGATGGSGHYNIPCPCNGPSIGNSPGSAGGKAINKNGKTVTFSGGCTRVYGAVS